MQNFLHGSKWSLCFSAIAWKVFSSYLSRSRLAPSLKLHSYSSKRSHDQNYLKWFWQILSTYCMGFICVTLHRWHYQMPVVWTRNCECEFRRHPVALSFFSSSNCSVFVNRFLLPDLDPFSNFPGFVTKIKPSHICATSRQTYYIFTKGCCAGNAIVSHGYNERITENMIKLVVAYWLDGLMDWSI